MSKNEGSTNGWGTYIASVIIGLGIGWLIGLSASPVLGIVLTGIIGAVAAIVLAAAGLKGEFDLVRTLDVVPMALMVIFIAVGSSIAVSVRTHNILGQDEQAAYWEDLHRDIDEWSNLTGQSVTDTAKILLANPTLQSASKEESAENKSVSTNGVLVTGGSVSECADLSSVYNSSALRGRLDEYPDLKVLSVITDVVALSTFIGEFICPPEN